nr:MAG TPA: hypothetical protein [Caudoviricetes sp.]
MIVFGSGGNFWNSLAHFFDFFEKFPPCCYNWLKLNKRIISKGVEVKVF